ncbi:MAG: hypothetical protein AB7O67_02640 [Vicinamibacterales bacterium]
MSATLPPGRPAPSSTAATCRYCASTATEVTSRRGTIVLRHCPACELFWVTRDDPKARPPRPRP